MIEFISQPWHWSISGAMIVMVMFLLIWLGKQFGVSSSFKALCSAVGGGRTCDYLDYNWKSHGWLLYFVAGSIIGGFIASNYLRSPEPTNLSNNTISDLAALGVEAPTYAGQMVPLDLFQLSQLGTLQGIVLFIIGGFLIGFGTRYAGGCTSGHAITGLSNLQLVSLIAVVGFFIGGLIMTHLIFPILF